MLWFFLALATAFFAATEATLVKGYLSDLTGLELASYPAAYSLPLFFLAVLLLPQPELGEDFWLTLIVLVPVNLVGFVSYLRGVSIAPLSVAMPFLAFTPVVVILTGFLFLGEMPSLLGFAGIGAIVAGSYVLHLDSVSPDRLLEPFRAIVRERGTVLVLVASVVFGLGAVMGKVLALQSDPLYAGAMFFFVHNLVFVAAVLVTGKVRPRTLVLRPGPGMLIGCILFVHIFCHFTAISMVDAAYMISVKRLSGLFAVLYGALVFKEAHIPTRLAGAACMSCGAALIALAE